MSVHPSVAFVPLDANLAEVAATWVNSAADVALFAGPSLSWPLVFEQILAVVHQQQRNVQVLLVDGLPVAMGSVQPMPCAVRIGWVLVDPQRRGQGWGRVIFTHLLALASSDPHADLVTLGVYEQNLAARTLYLGLGFTDTDTRRVLSVDGTDWVSVEMEYRPTAGLPGS
ncbi:N-acetyltransferase [Propionicimonas sp.]|uniref:GNAT family N-acetyltransferase n=1 Tax=Propionicimonas sp. TaxID=1955623 RepID=UPI00178ED4B7|nr:GNAT family N-acetyltransferase [Propionicimonas sp.]MBU3976273.1 GNAT family N-acetyltransferase [Actinomycetota bacterium]MBA3021085.1 GNAT family N-acetyltransferase [Propionicimonas sp.]MBU3985668.1 GNAT family N-acetyltransferase [Actinomycetota bacterium]MBU4008453.1 GNAT family N-acetyltransferase [Actinomycetota bacterium]MBU4066397.1 GNAT family N-acetyltransferase [Actinomycetota bacterium]